MATLEELRENIQFVVDDDTYSSDRINALINSCCRYCASKVLLADLESSGVFSTEVGTASVSIPTTWNFSRNLYSCTVQDTDKITILPSVSDLLEIYPNYETDLIEGDIEYVVIKGSSIIYYPVPAEVTTVNAKFYIAPTKLSKNKDVPTWFPEGTHEELIENYVLWKIFSTVEAGIEGPKKDTEYYGALFQMALDNLDSDINIGQSRPETYRTSNWI